MAKKLYSRVAYVEVYEDDYEEGEGKMTQWYDLPLTKGVFDTVKELEKEVAIYFSSDIELVYLRDCEYFCTSLLINDEGYAATTQEIEEWKRGERKLYSLNLTVPVKVVEFSTLEAGDTEFGYFEAE